MQRLLFLASPERSQALLTELGHAFPDAAHRVIEGDWIDSQFAADARLDAPALAFVQQCLPHASEITATSISTWGRAVVDQLLTLRDHPGPWRLHVYRAEQSPEGTGLRRAQLIEETILKDLKERRRKLWRNRTQECSAPWSAEEVLAQIVLRTATEGWISICSAAERAELNRCLSRFPAGRVEVPADPSAPSGAHAKLREMLARWGRRFAPRESVVDLGASPGGWSYVALEQGASVIAIDRSPLRDDLMQHPKLRLIQANAFEFAPDAQVDWLLSDLIAYPRDILNLLDRWLSGNWCKSFCVTIKFKGSEDYPILREFAARLDQAGAEYCLRRLDHNRNEVTAYGTVGPAPSSWPILC